MNERELADRKAFVDEYKELCIETKKSWDKEEADKKAYVDEYLDLYRKYGLVIDCVDDDDHLEINDITFESAPSQHGGITGYDMKMFTRYMKGLV